MKEGNNKKIGGSFSISPIAGRLSLEGPIGKSGKTTFAVSGRRTFLDIITKPFFQKGNSFGYYFYDFNAKVCHTFSQKDKIFVSFYSGIDKFKITATNKDTQGGTTATDKSSVILKWGNQTGAFRWNHVISNKLFSNYTLNFTRFQFDVINTFEQTRQTDTTFDQAGLYLRYFSGIRDWAVKADYEYTPDARNKIRFGGSYINHGFAPGAAQLKFTGNGPGNLDTLLGPNGRIYTNELAIYGEDERRITKRVKVNGGLRAVGYNVRGKTTFYLEPRFSLNKNFDGKFAIKGAYSMMNQFLHLLANSGTSLPTDLWVPATDKIKPQTSQQVSIGLNVPLKQAFEFTVEGYYKWMKNLIDYKEGANFAAINQSWEDKVLAGNGQSYGAEFLIQKKTGPLTGWIGYTLAWANRRIIGINNDKTYPFKYDRRHDVSLVSSYKYSEKYTFSASVVFSTGNAITFPIGQYLDINGNVVYEYGSKNAFRLNNNSRLDIGYTKMLDKKRNKRNLEQSWTFSIYNVLAHNNPYYVYVDNTTSPAKVKQISLFGFVPGIAYNLKF
ncbi:MAG: TonB-dependent receptor, partial [Bacteroidia bacterium]|nr:TonB-dependent receptor [Bacteroidia bacterium]